MYFIYVTLCKHGTESKDFFLTFYAKQLKMLVFKWKAEVFFVNTKFVIFIYVIARQFNAKLKYTMEMWLLLQSCFWINLIKFEIEVEWCQTTCKYKVEKV